MSGIFGLVRLDGAPVQVADIMPMREAMAHWGPDGVRIWTEGAAGFGQCVLFNTPEALSERLPRVSTAPRFALTAEARIDNRDELFDLLDVGRSERTARSDGDLIMACYAAWGVDAVRRLYGDWSFAAWHADHRRLVLARDHHGQTALYYFTDGRRVAFASDRRALLALPGVSQQLNEVFLAKLMVVWPGYHGGETAFQSINRLPPAHHISIDQVGERLERYWRLEDTPVTRLSSPQESRDRLSEAFHTAVKCRLRTHRPIGSTLSGGLDSGLVTAIAARELAQHSEGLAAFTAVPAFQVAGLDPGWIGDEWPLARATASRFANILHVRVDSRESSPLDGVRRWLEIHREPPHAAENTFWLLDVLAAAREQGIGTLLFGRGGNSTISWSGPVRSPGLSGRIRSSALLAPLRYLYRRARSGAVLHPPWHAYSAIAPSFARRVGLRGIMQSEGYVPFGAPARDTRQARAAFLLPGRSIGGALVAENAAAFGIEMRDPTVDVRVITAAFSIPDDHWAGPTPRWLARCLADGLLPESVRFNVRPCQQAGDLLSRIRHDEREMRRMLATVSASAGVREFVDLAYLRVSLDRVISPSSARFMDGVRLTRGVANACFMYHPL